MILGKSFRNKYEEMDLYWLFSVCYMLKCLKVINDARYLYPQFQKDSKSWNGVQQLLQEIWNVFGQQVVIKVKSCLWNLQSRDNLLFS